MTIEGRDEWLAAAGRTAPNAVELVGIRPSTAQRRLADLRARSGLTPELLMYVGRAADRQLIQRPEARAPNAGERPGAQ